MYVFPDAMLASCWPTFGLLVHACINGAIAHGRPDGALSTSETAGHKYPLVPKTLIHWLVSLLSVTMVLFECGASQLLEPEAKQHKTGAAPPAEPTEGHVDVNSIVNLKLVEAQYAVRGPITDRAVEIEKQLASGKHDFSFQKVLYCNIGNPQSLGQAPISYLRRLMALCECPDVRHHHELPSALNAQTGASKCSVQVLLQVVCAFCTLPRLAGAS